MADVGPPGIPAENWLLFCHVGRSRRRCIGFLNEGSRVHGRRELVRPLDSSAELIFCHIVCIGYLLPVPEGEMVKVKLLILIQINSVLTVFTMT